MPAALLKRVAGAAGRSVGLGGASFAAPAGPQPFELACVTCGNPIAGTRSADARFEPCGACGTRNFVLPADVYPRPPAPKAPPKKPREPPRPAAPPATDAAPKPNSGRRFRTASVALAKAVRKRATPVRLAALGTLLVVAGTAWWAVRDGRVRAARQALIDAPPAAAAALDEGRFEDAAAAYAAEAAALGTLGRAESRPAELARQRAREATAAAGLASQTPLQIAREAAAATTPTARTAWHRAFAALHAGRWVVLDALAAAVPPADGGSRKEGNEKDGDGPPGPRTELLYPFGGGPGGGGRVRARLVGDPAVPAGLSPADPPRRVVLAARYGACARVADPAGGPPVWELRLEPGSAFLWATPATLAAVGFDPTDPALAAVLAEQAAALGLAEPENPAPDAPAE